MEIVTFRSPSAHPGIFKSSDFVLSGYDMVSLITTMKQSTSWANGELNALILLKSRDKKVVLTAMPQGTEITSYQSNDSVKFQIIEGRIQFNARKDEAIISDGQEMTYNENSRYRLTAQKETVFLLTIFDKIVIAGSN